MEIVIMTTLIPKNVPNKPIKLSKKKEILEKDVEGDNRVYCKKLNVLFEKYTSLQKMSVPDRLLTFPNGLMVFIEYKRPGKRATPKQFIDHQQRRERGVLVYVIDTKESGRRLIDRLLILAMDSLLEGDWHLSNEIMKNAEKYTSKDVVEG